MDYFKKLFKSKTINFNALVPAIVALLAAFGVAVPTALVTAILVIGNMVLRMITKEAITDK
ncbi:MAG: hypothetical protein H8D34_27620 [Chloroflexi bacterium]|nr:hypothetical protein [Chloroflexota bacterium]